MYVWETDSVEKQRFIKLCTRLFRKGEADIRLKWQSCTDCEKLWMQNKQTKRKQKQKKKNCSPWTRNGSKTKALSRFRNTWRRKCV